VVLALRGRWLKRPYRGLLIGVFIYWGWESSVNLTEETEHSESAPGLAAIASTVILLVTYLSVAAAVVAFGGVGTAEKFADDAILSTLATGVLGSPWDKLVVLAVLTSALASTQTTILPASRTVLSMARAGAMPSYLGETHPRFFTPHVSTIVVGALATIWYVPLNFLSENFLFDTLSALSLMIAFYYALTGFACAIYYRHELFKSAKNFVFIGAAPVLGALLLTYLFFRSVIDLSDPGASYTGGSFLGFGVPLVIGVGFLLLGAILMVLWRLGGHESFFGRTPETVDPEVAQGRVKVPEGEQPPHGELVDERTYAPYHQHFLVARLDLDIDGQDNTVYMSESEALPVGPDNPHGLALVQQNTPLRTEEEGKQDYNWHTQRSWKVVNDDVKNGLSTSVGYKLVPDGCFPAMLDPSSPVLERAGVIGLNLWVTPYREDERWPCGEFVNQSAADTGLAEWIKENRPIEDTDVVLWYVFGLHHITRPEDWPVMPVDTVSFWLKPAGFFDRNPALDVASTVNGHCHDQGGGAS
jgi:Copper amine oxidase, enzyme domain/Amino acid permease